MAWHGICSIVCFETGKTINLAAVNGLKLEIGKQKFEGDGTRVWVGCIQTGKSVIR